jgi:hypothetical protein
MSGSNSNMARSHLSPGGIAICYRTPLYPSIPTDGLKQHDVCIPKIFIRDLTSLLYER